MHVAEFGLMHRLAKLANAVRSIGSNPIVHVVEVKDAYFSNSYHMLLCIGGSTEFS